MVESSICCFWIRTLHTYSNTLVVEAANLVVHVPQRIPIFLCFPVALHDCTDCQSSPSKIQSQFSGENVLPWRYAKKCGVILLLLQLGSEPAAAYLRVYTASSVATRATSRFIRINFLCKQCQMSLHERATGNQPHHCG